jgi:hypothetical protein
MKDYDVLVNEADRKDANRLQRDQIPMLATCIEYTHLVGGVGPLILYCVHPNLIGYKYGNCRL